MGGKRPNENDNSHPDEIEESSKRMGRFELHDSDDESSLYGYLLIWTTLYENT